MNIISMILFYWVTILLSLIFAKAMGIADNTPAFIAYLVIVTIMYILITRKKLAKLNKEKTNSVKKAVKQYNGSSHGKKKKRHN